MPEHQHLQISTDCILETCTLRKRNLMLKKIKIKLQTNLLQKLRKVFFLSVIKNKFVKVLFKIIKGTGQ